MKRIFIVLALTAVALTATAQQRPLKPRADAFPSVKEALDAKSIVMATTVEEMAGWDWPPGFIC